MVPTEEKVFQGKVEIFSEKIYSGYESHHDNRDYIFHATVFSYTVQTDQISINFQISVTVFNSLLLLTMLYTAIILIKDKPIKLN